MSAATRAAIFDLDGVLVDSEPLYTLATQEVITPFGKTYDWSLKARCMGNPATVSARIIVESLALPITPEAFLERREVTLLRLLETVPEVAGASQFVAALAAAGFQLAVATSSNRKLFSLKTRHHGWMSHFSAVVCGDDAELARPKPAPDIFLLAARRLGCNSKECVVIEDSPAGVRAAVAAGMRVIALAHSALERELFAGAFRIVSGYSELAPDLLESLG